MLAIVIAYALAVAEPPPPVRNDWRVFGDFEIERTQQLTWPGLYQLSLLSAPERRLVTRFTLRRTRGFLDLSIITVSKTFGTQLPGREVGDVTPSRGSIWGEVAVRVPKLPGRIGSRFLFRGNTVRPGQLFLSGRF